ncbi:MAG: response regulator transcription factor [Bacteroidetes bacterium]|nr:response regulator transcription factor [Bacteroidota bacterium]
MKRKTINLVLAGPQTIYRKALAHLLVSSGPYRVVAETDDIDSIFQKLDKLENLMASFIIDSDMPGLYPKIKLLKRRWPEAKVLVLFSHKSEFGIHSLLRLGVNGVLLKTCKERNLYKAIDEINAEGYHYNDLAGKELFEAIRWRELRVPQFMPKHQYFLSLCAGPKRYEDMMKPLEVTSYRSVEGYRNKSYKILNVNNRGELVAFALKAGLIHLT